MKSENEIMKNEQTVITGGAEKELLSSEEANVSDVVETANEKEDDSLVKKRTADGSESNPSLSDVLRIASMDRRVGHYILDLLSGVNADVAYKEHFTSVSAEETERMLKEAEERGYLRGRNDRIEAEMRMVSPDDDEGLTVSDYSSEFLKGRSRRVW